MSAYKLQQHLNVTAASSRKQKDFAYCDELDMFLDCLPVEFWGGAAVAARRTIFSRSWQWQRYYKFMANLQQFLL